MATQTVNIQVTVNGAAPAARQIAGIGTAARQAHDPVFNLRNLLLGFSVTALVGQLGKFADTAIRIDNRLNVLTGSVSRSNELFNALFQVARDTRSALEPTIDTYARLERSTVGLNLTSQQLIDLTKGINQTFQIFGNTSKEAEAALVQFTQGLSVGVLRGDELRSVLEQAPRLAKGIADGLNAIPEGKALGEKFGVLFRDFETGAISSEVLAGSLRELGKEGKLSAELITKGLLTQLPKFQEEFARTSGTIKDAITIFQNQLIKLARSPEAKEFGKQIAEGIIFVADNLEKVAQFLAPFGVVLLNVFGLVKDLVFIFGELFLGIFEGFKAAIEITGIFYDTSEKSGEEFVNRFSDGIQKVFSFLGKWIGATLDVIVRGLGGLGGLVAATTRDITLAFIKAFDFIAKAAEGLVNTLIDGVNVFKSEQDKIAKVDFSFFSEAAKKDFIDPIQAAADGAEGASQAFKGIIQPIQVAMEKSGVAVANFAQRTKEGLDKINAARASVASATGGTLGQIPGGKERLPTEIPLSANDQRRLDSFNDRLAKLREGSLDAQDALRELVKAQEQYNKLAQNEEIAKRLTNRIDQEKEFAELRKKFSDQAVAELLEQSKAQQEAAQVSLDHYKAQRLLTRALENGIPPTQEQIDLLAKQLANERAVLDAQKEKDNILDSLTRKANQYNAVLAATNELVAKGVLNETQQNRFLRDTEVGREVESAKDMLAERDPQAKLNRELEMLAEEEALKQDALRAAGEADISRQMEFQELSLELAREYERQKREITLESQRLQYEQASTAFGDLAELSKGFVKESSGVYKALFVASKAFAIAEGVVKLNQAIINASASLPFPANLAAMATVAAQGLNLLNTIRSIAPPAPAVAAAEGGLITGPGGPTDDRISAALSNGEFVVRAAAVRDNLPLLQAINSGLIKGGGGPGMTVTQNLTQNFSGSGNRDEFRTSGRQAADQSARALERQLARL